MCFRNKNWNFQINEENPIFLTNISRASSLFNSPKSFRFLSSFLFFSNNNWKFKQKKDLPETTETAQLDRQLVRLFALVFSQVWRVYIQHQPAESKKSAHATEAQIKTFFLWKKKKRSDIVVLNIYQWEWVYVREKKR